MHGTEKLLFYLHVILKNLQDSACCTLVENTESNLDVKNTMLEENEVSGFSVAYKYFMCENVMKHSSSCGGREGFYGSNICMRVFLSNDRPHVFSLFVRW